MKGHELPGTAETVYLLALRNLGRPLSSGQVREALALAGPTTVSTPSLRSVHGCLTRMVDRGWVGYVASPGEGSGYVFFRPLAEGLRVLEVVLARIDTARSLCPRVEAQG